MAKAKTRSRGKRPAPSYTSDTLAASRRMVAPGPDHEELAVIHDLSWRYRNLQSQLRYYDRRTGEPIAKEAEVMRKEAERRIALLPDADLRERMTAHLYK